MSNLYPMLIKPSYDERIWGGTYLAAKLGKDAPAGKRIGESWEIYEENLVLNGPYAGQTIGALRETMGRDLTGVASPDQLFPLLTKLIDAQEALSVQVHPDDHFARLLEKQPYGKTECWYVVDAAPGATVTFGFSRDTNPDEYTRLVETGELQNILRSLPVKPGDVIYIPAGMVHAINAGVVVFELQQTSDVTYRIYDWNRRDAEGKARELHVEKARQVLDYHRARRGLVQPLESADGSRSMLVAGPHFTLDLIDASSVGWVSTEDSPVCVLALAQAVTVQVVDTAVRLPRYSSLLVPAAAGSFSLQPAESNGGPARILSGSIPRSQEATRSELQSRGFSAEEIDGFLAQFAAAEDLGQGAT